MCIHVCVFVCVFISLHMCIHWAGYFSRGLGRAGEGVTRRSGGWEYLRFRVTVQCVSGRWRSLSLALSFSLSLKRLFTHALTHLPIIHPSIHSISHSLTVFLSLSLCGVYVRACVRVPLSFFLSLSPLHQWRKQFFRMFGPELFRIN